MRGFARRAVVATAMTALIGAMLSACGSSGGGGGRVTLNFYNFPDPSGAIQQAVDTCSKQSAGRYVIKYNKLPAGADGQRQQLVRRLAAARRVDGHSGYRHHLDGGVGGGRLDPPVARGQGSQASNGTLNPLHTGTWKGELYAAPFNTNVQLLWYRSDLVPKPPTTWDEMITWRQPRRGEQASSDRDPGRAIRGGHRLVQHPGVQRRWQRAHRRLYCKPSLGSPPSRP